MSRELRVVISGDSRSLDSALSRAGNNAKGFGSTMDKVGRGAKIAATALGVGFAGALKVGFDELAESQKVTAQTGAVLKSTGAVAGVTAKQVESLAGAISAKSGIDDEAIQSGENLLLTFTNVRNEVGRGNDVFNQATRTMADMSTALGQDMKSSAIQLGKALNDPIKGVTALQRVGVSFTAAQKEQIKSLVDSGKTLEAQKLILRELNKEFGGSAEAAGKTLPGQLAKAKMAFEDMAANLAQALLPALTKLARFVERASGFLSEHKQLTLVVSGILAGLAAAVWSVNAALGAYRAAAVAATVVQRLFNAAVLANPYVAAAAAIAAVVAALVMLEMKFGVVTKAIQAVREAFEVAFNWVRDNWPEIVTLIAGPFAPLVALATDAFGVRSALVGAFTAVKSFVGARIDDVVGFFTNLPARLLATLESLKTTALTPFRAAFTSAKTWVGEKVDDVVDFFTGLPARILATLGSLVSTALSPFQDKFTAAKAWVGARLDDVAGFFSKLPSRIVGTLGSLEDTALKPFREAFETAADLVRKALEKLVDVIDQVKAGVVWLGQRAGGIIQSGVAAISKALSAVTKAFEPLRDILGAIVGAVQYLIDAIPKIPEPNIGGLGPGGLDIPGIPGLAAGGIVMRPTLAVVGEAGPEAVVPLRSAGLGGGVNVTVHVAGSVLTERQLADAIALPVRDALRRHKRAGGEIGLA